MDKIKRDQKCKVRYLTGPTGPSGDNNIRNAYLTTFNDGSEFSVNPDSRIPINNEEINNNQLITLEKDNNVFNFNLSGYYKITFIVSSYPDFNSQVFDSNTDFVSIALKEVDGVYVLDAGSSDNTVQKLRDRGVFVLEKEISPWRFDKVRNESLKLVPSDADICICLDLDEVILTTDLITVNHYPDNNKSRDRYLELLELSVEMGLCYY